MRDSRLQKILFTLSLFAICMAGCSQSEKTVSPSEDDDENEELKDLLNYLKDMENPKSCGLELSEEDQKALSDWMKEIKQEEELRKFRDFLAKI